MPLTTNEHQAKAQGKNMPVSWKDCTEIGRFVQDEKIDQAISKLEKVTEKDLEVPYTKFDSDVGHRPGQSTPGKYPVKAAEEVISVLKNAKNNAEQEGLNTDATVIKEFITNQGREFRTPSRHQGTTKAAHVKIIVEEQ